MQLLRAVTTLMFITILLIVGAVVTTYPLRDQTLFPELDRAIDVHGETSTVFGLQFGEATEEDGLRILPTYGFTVSPKPEWTSFETTYLVFHGVFDNLNWHGHLLFRSHRLQNVQVVSGHSVEESEAIVPLYEGWNIVDHPSYAEAVYTQGLYNDDYTLTLMLASDEITIGFATIADCPLTPHSIWASRSHGIAISDRRGYTIPDQHFPFSVFKITGGLHNNFYYDVPICGVASP